MEKVTAIPMPQPLVRTIAYWTVTGLIVLETAVGSEWDLARIQFVRDVFTHLGYPFYMLTILGIWKLPAAIVLAIPRFPRVKEWAYTGLFLVYSGAAASHIMAGYPKEAWSPFIFAVLTALSWALRPASRRMTIQPTEARTRGRRVGFWVSTIIVAFCMISGGIAELAGAKSTIDGIMVLGYPAYFAKIIGFWKVLGGLCIVLPRLSTPKEWAYAGIFFNMTGAAVSNAVAGTAGWHIAVNLMLAALAVISWALRKD